MTKISLQKNVQSFEQLWIGKPETVFTGVDVTAEEWLKIYFRCLDLWGSPADFSVIYLSLEEYTEMSQFLSNKMLDVRYGDVFISVDYHGYLLRVGKAI